MNVLRALWQGNPVLVTSTVTALVVAVCARLGAVIDEQSIGEAVALALPILLGGIVARGQVEPAKPAVIPSDEALFARVGDMPPDPEPPEA